MATIINNPGNRDGSDSSGAVSLIVGIIFLLVVVGLFFVYALPAIRNGNANPQNSSIDVNVKLPAGEKSPAPTPVDPAN